MSCQDPSHGCCCRLRKVNKPVWFGNKSHVSNVSCVINGVYSECLVITDKQSDCEKNSTEIIHKCSLFRRGVYWKWTQSSDAAIIAHPLSCPLVLTSGAPSACVYIYVENMFSFCVTHFIVSLVLTASLTIIVSKMSVSVLCHWMSPCHPLRVTVALTVTRLPSISLVQIRPKSRTPEANLSIRVHNCQGAFIHYRIQANIVNNWSAVIKQLQKSENTTALYLAFVNGPGYCIRFCYLKSVICYLLWAVLPWFGPNSSGVELSCGSIGGFATQRFRLLLCSVD